MFKKKFVLLLSRRTINLHAVVVVFLSMRTLNLYRVCNELL